ncbi:PRD domain-containing protein [Vagococcus lutrae]|uniref:BglG family transcription antiterminator n=1 Tax=Vagococcus lutrae TaxID=81947 RepID=UPI0020981214|nr:PRD domain-containing protein [Vagococcus lutrae]MCO7150655.1 PRD domain-containing protein [Vagococcus lutrae]MDT2812192.1 PRD domain-containing protein [Vagococcus lutrae]MDT2818489.1 PRD domain-containing protein [Vagococcus lutrae]MDT2843447.1 PRD domain-containing protein [Vagococcus lutrae]WCG05228.1 PRD domain-containing protein [Vagococcus lutrae]
MRPKERELLLHLIHHQEEFVTSIDLASELSLSDRTVRTYMNHLKDLVIQNGGEISSKRGHGYCLRILNKLDFDLFLNEQGLNFNYEEHSPRLTDITDRKNYILNKLLLEEATVNLDDLAEELFISRSSLNKDIQEIKEQLRSYQLSLCSKHGIGLYIEGDERHKRHFILDYFFGKNYTNSLKKYLGNSPFFQDISFEELTIIILDEIREEKLKISDIIIQNLVLHLALSIKRLKEGFEIKELGIKSDISDRIEYQVAKNIVKRIEDFSQTPFPDEEISYLALHLMAKSNHSVVEENQELSNEINEAMTDLSKNLCYSISEDYQLRVGLLDHLKPMLIRLERNISLDNPLTSEIKKNYTRAFELTKKYLGKMPVLQQYHITDDEWAYLTLHVMAAMEKAKDLKKIRALIICATGYGSAQLLKNRVINEFESSIMVTNVQGYYEINDTSLKEADLIISSIDLSTMVFPIPVIHVSVFLNDEDVNKIRRIIQQIGKEDRLIDHPQLNSKKSTHNERIIMEQMDESLFKVYQYTPSKDEVLYDLAELLSVNEAENYSKELLEQIEHRQQMGQVIFSESIVVPHPALPVGITTKVAVALIPEGMEWDEAEQIRFVFLISPSYIENQGITVITKAIVKLVDCLSYQENMLKNPNFNQFKKLLLELS